MARIGLPKVDTAGMYNDLLNAYQEDLRARVANLSRTHHDGEPYPCQGILDDLRAGRTANVPVHSHLLPRSALEAAPKRFLYTSPWGRPVYERPMRAIVRPDDTVTFTDDDWVDLWLEENGL